MIWMRILEVHWSACLGDEENTKMLTAIKDWGTLSYYILQNMEVTEESDSTTNMIKTTLINRGLYFETTEDELLYLMVQPFRPGEDASRFTGANLFQYAGHFSATLAREMVHFHS